MAVTTSNAGHFCVHVGGCGPPRVGVPVSRSGHGHGSVRAKISNLKYTASGSSQQSYLMFMLEGSDK